MLRNLAYHVTNGQIYVPVHVSRPTSYSTDKALQGRITRYIEYARTLVPIAPEGSLVAKILFHINIRPSLVIVTLFAHCFPKISNFFVSSFENLRLKVKACVIPLNGSRFRATEHHLPYRITVLPPT